MRTVEVRCPVGPQKLFTKLKLGQEFAKHLVESNLIEFTCHDCSKFMSRELGRAVQTYHRFNFVGELVQTRTEEKWARGTSTPQ